MVKRKKKEHDFAVNAFRVMKEATGQTENETKQQKELPEPKKDRKL